MTEGISLLKMTGRDTTLEEIKKTPQDEEARLITVHTVSGTKVSPNQSLLYFYPSY